MKTCNLKRLVISHKFLLLLGNWEFFFIVFNNTSINQKLPGTFFRLESLCSSLLNGIDLLLNGDLGHIDRHKVFKSMNRIHNQIYISEFFDMQTIIHNKGKRVSN